MKKSLLFCSLIVAFMCSTSLLGQEGTYTFDKRIAPNANGISVDLQGEPEFVEQALRSKFEKLGYKKPKSMRKGLYMYEAAVLTSISDATLNYYYRVEETKGSSNSSTLSFFLSPGNNNFWSSEKFPQEMRKAEQMLYGLEVEVATLKMQEKILAQKEVIEKEEKKESDLQKSEEDMVKLIAKLERQIVETQESIENNKIEQEDQAKVLEKEREKLEDLLKDLEDIIKR